MALIGPIGQKMKIFNFVLESKLDLHCDVKFEGECENAMVTVPNFKNLI